MVGGAESPSGEVGAAGINGFLLNWLRVQGVQPLSNFAADAS